MTFAAQHQTQNVSRHESAAKPFYGVGALAAAPVGRGIFAGNVRAVCVRE